MFQISQFRTDEPLTTEQAKFIDERIAVAARQVLVGRKLAPVRGPVGLGVQLYSYDKLSEMSAAQVDFLFSALSKDTINLTRLNVPIPVLHKEFQIDRRDLESSRRMGTPLDSSAAEAAAYKVGLQEDTLLIEGYAPDGTNYRIQGFYQAAGNDYSTAKDFGTATNIPDAINGAISLLIADGVYPPYNILLHPTQWGETNVLIANTGRSYREWIREAVGGEVYVSPAITTGTGLMCAGQNAGFFEIVVGQDLTTELELQPLSLGGSLFGRVYECLVPIVKDSNALCKLSSI